MEFTKLTEEQGQFFEENGYLIVRNALDEKQVARLIEAGDRFMESQEQPAHNYYMNRYVDLTFDDAFLELITNSSTVPLVVQLLSPDIHMRPAHLIYKYPQPESSSPVYPEGVNASTRNWHRDLNNFAPHHPIRNTVEIRVGYCLTDFSRPNTGITTLVPGSHRLTEPMRFQKGFLDPPDFLEPLLRPGDALLFSTCTYHFTAVNFSDQVAKLIIACYSYLWWSHRWTDFIPFNVTDELLEKVDDITAQLLGCIKREGYPKSIPLRAWAKKHGIFEDDPPMRVFV